MGEEKSANEIEALVLKAARGGGLPLGLAEDLAMASAFLDFEKLAVCPCHAGGAANVIPHALDLVAAGNPFQSVDADPATIAAYVALAEIQSGKTLIWELVQTGAVFHRFEEGATVATSLGRRSLPAELEAHLVEMASKTLVPETNASRAAGAGAGLTDND